MRVVQQGSKHMSTLDHACSGRYANVFKIASTKKNLQHNYRAHIKNHQFTLASIYNIEQ